MNKSPVIQLSVECDDFALMSKLRTSNIQISPLVVSGAGIGTYYNITLLCSYWRPGADLGRGHAGDLHQRQRPSSGQVQYSTVQYSTVQYSTLQYCSTVQRPSSGLVTTQLSSN